MKRTEVSRRSFLAGSLGGWGLLILGKSNSARSYQANQKLDVAIVGAGGRGKWFVDTIPKMENVVALCDVNEKRAAESFKRLPKAAKHQDFRKMLDQMRKQIDAVIVATPDHVHAPACACAMKAGKHVFCEKPLTRSVSEARAMRELAARHKVATQMGNQGMSSGEFRRSAELIQAGSLGPVQEVHVWNSGGGPGRREVPKDTPPVPQGLNWDLWLGPAPYRPYHPAWLAWSGWRDFGTGQLGLWASHTASLAFYALKLPALWLGDGPAKDRTVRIEAEVSEIEKSSFPRWEVVRSDFPARGDMPPVRIHWYNGNPPGKRKFLEDLMKRRLDWGDAGERKWKDWAGCLIVGQQGMIYANGHNATCTMLPEATFKNYLHPDEKTKTLAGPKPWLPHSQGPERDWFAACRGGPQGMSSFAEFSGPFVEFLMLGNAATQVQGNLEFDPAACKVVNNAPADGLLRREYRRGWSL